MNMKRIEGLPCLQVICPPLGEGIFNEPCQGAGLLSQAETGDMVLQLIFSQQLRLLRAE